MSRSGRISDLSDLVDQAKASRSDGQPGAANPSSQSVGPARSAPPRGPAADTRSLPPNAASGTMGGAGGGGGGADDASMSSFSRSVARVARDSDSAGGSSRGGGRPPPRGGSSSYGGSVSGSSSYSSGRGSSRRSGTTPGSGQSNATDRLMSLVNELSQPRTPGGGPSASGGAAGGYLPSQYTGRGGGGRSPPGSVRSRSTPVGPPPGPGSVGGSSSYSRRSSGVSAYTGTSGISSARNSRNGASRNSGGARSGSGSSDPVGFVMPPQYAPGPPPGGDGASERSGDFTSDSRSSAASESEEQGTQYSYGSQTSAGQSTMPTEYTNTGFPDSTFVGGPMGPDPSAGGSQVGSQMSGSYASGSQQNSYMSGSQQNSYASGSQHDSYMSGSQQETYMSGSQQNSYVSGSQQNSYMGASQQETYMTGAPMGAPAGMQMPGVSFASQASGQSQGGMNPYAVAPYLHDPGMGYDPGMDPGMGPADQSYAPSSQSSRSLANSAALIPKARFSWASESLGPQSTIMSSGHRSLNTASVPEPQMAQRDGGKVTEGRIWASFAWIITFFIPNKCISRPTKDAKQAWREKVALFVTMVSCSTFFVGVFGFVPLLLCKEDKIFSMGDIWLQTGENWVVVHGVIYDVKDLIYKHPGGVKGIVDYLGKDGSKVFPRAPPVTLPEKCLDMEKVLGYNLGEYSPENNFTNPTCASFSELDVLLGITCHTFAAGSNGTAKFLGDYERGILSHTTIGLNDEGLQWFALYDRVYDVTNYIKAINENREPSLEDEEGLDNNPAAWLTPTLNKVVMNSLGGDATDLYEALFGSSEYIACLEEMFYHGLLDDEFDTFCATLNIMMYCMLVFVATLMVVQFMASMIYVCPRHRTYSEEDVMSPVMIMVPCYNEGDNELRKTIKSVLNTTYPDENKVLFMVADGLVTGNGEDMSTPEHLANILGFDIDEFEDDTFEYDCIGVIHTKNRARVYHGILQKGHKFLKYISIVKCGLPEEATTSAKPGNRGKRDSQLIVMGYYNRIHYGRELTELDSAVQRAMVDLNLQADMVRFLMAIDADTRVDTMSITHMVYGMDKKEKVLALCGETKVDNKASSWVTMIQVFEYYNSHHLKKAFEAAFGCVTCLPGCFTMYRIIADDGTPLLPGDGVLYEYSRNDVETLHEKNLYHLGEDRMLTTLLLKYYPDRSLTFIPEAACWTIVPHTFRILLSQRRRWINSTVHNMFELLKVNTMCGVCCVSMKVVVFIDLIATMILPASYVYAMYLLFLVFFEDLPVSTVLLILYGIIMGVQVVVFILRSRWEYLWWFFIYFTIGLPVFYLILPTYSFWNMDDFSWGKTRAVGGSGVANAGEEVDDGDDEEEDDDGDDDSEYSSDEEDDETAALTRRSEATGRSRGSQGGSRPPGARFQDDDESSSEEESSDEEESEDDETEYSRSMADQDEYFSQASRSRFSAPR